MIEFTWDPRKGLANQKKHGISFAEAKTVFLDDNHLVYYDPDHSDDEDRYIILGMSISLRLIVVVHCYRNNEEEIRIISARKATKEESAYYEAGASATGFSDERWN